MTAAVCPTCGQRFEHAGYCPADGQPLVATDDALLGTEIGRYRLARVLGEGGMGRVYLAVQPAIGSRVAIKVLAESCARDPDLLDRFFAEARAVNLIRHERIVSVLDMAVLADGRPYIVMEYIEGKTLAAIARSGPVPLGGLVQVMSEVLSALAAAHAIGIVHRDLKPDNILVTAEGHAKVLDFGIAKLAPELQARRSPRTRTGALLGTPQYMAPEQISGAAGVDARTDLYAAGVVVYELATGKLPFVGETLFDLMRAHLEEPPPPPRAVRRDLPPALEQVILTALAKRPEARFASAAAMAHALQQAAAGLPAEQWRSLSARGPTAASGSRSEALRATKPVGAAPTVGGGQRVWLAIGAIVVVAIAVVATLFFASHRRAPVAVSEAPAPVAVAVIEARGSDAGAIGGDARVDAGGDRVDAGGGDGVDAGGDARVDAGAHARAGSAAAPAAPSPARPAPARPRPPVAAPAP
ncbi:MAG TPA: serine/threonine-protein kinase, partial [Kofleriaceae bacterium]|nr:serine/threonine-protein kinase [Kofleriaceae bacterium]